MDAQASACPVCVGRSRPELVLHDVQLRRCLACDHCYTDVSQLSHHADYDASYYEEHHRNWFANPNLFLFDTIARLAKQERADASVLDVGCGRGDLLKHLHASNPRFHLTGIDLSSPVPQPAIEIVQGDFLTHRFDKRFDVVTSLAVIEHVPDVAAFMQRLIDACNPGGLIIVMTLNDRSILYAAARALSVFGLSGPVVRLYDRHHLNHFTNTSLTRLAERMGVSVVNLINHNIPLGAVDFEAGSRAARVVMQAGVWGTFALGTLTSRTYLQTLVSRRSRG